MLEAFSSDPVRCAFILDLASVDRPEVYQDDRKWMGGTEPRWTTTPTMQRAHFRFRRHLFRSSWRGRGISKKGTP